MKFIELSAIRRELNEAAQKRLDAFDDGEDDYEAPTDSNGNSLDFYLDNNLKVPEELKEASKNSDVLRFDLEEDYDKYLVEVLVNMDDFSMAVDEVNEEGCTIYLKSGTHVMCIETADEIHAQIWWKTRTSWQQFKDYCAEIKRKLTNKFNNKQK